MVDAVAGELLGGRSAENEVALKTSVDNLHDDLLVGEANNEAVLRGVVLVLGLGDEALAGVVVGLALAPSSELRLVALEVGFGFCEFDERHL